nr:putative ribonuclease H-like domain-containing protein [Tanacetum cinerariifolium]
ALFITKGLGFVLGKGSWDRGEMCGMGDRDECLGILHLWSLWLTGTCNVSPVGLALVTKSHNTTPYELFNGTQDNVDAGKEVFVQHYIVLPLWSSISSTFESSDDKAADDKPKDDIGSKTVEEPVNKEDQAYRDELDRLISQEKEASDAVNALRKKFEQGCMNQRRATKAGSTNSFNTVSNPVNVTSTSGTFSASRPSSPHPDAFIPANTLLHVNPNDSQIPDLEDTAELRSTSIFNSAYNDDLDIFSSPIQIIGAEAGFHNMESCIVVSPIPPHRVHIDHPKDQILGDPKSIVQTRRMEKKSSGAHAFMEPKKVSQALDDESWVEAMQEELLNKKDERGIVVKNKARLVAQGHKQEEGIDNDEVTPKLSHLHAVKRIFRYLKGQPKLGLWYPRDSPFDLEAYSDSDYAGANLDRKSTTKGFQFLGRRLISWQCKKQTIVATSTTEAEYVAAAN